MSEPDSATVEQLVTETQELIKSAKGLQDRAAFDRRIIRFLGAVVAVMFLALVGIGVLEVEAVHSRNQISSCTTPDGKCFRENQARFRATLGEASRGNADVASAAAACTQTNRGYVAVRACVERTLKG